MPRQQQQYIPANAIDTALSVPGGIVNRLSALFSKRAYEGGPLTTLKTLVDPTEVNQGAAVDDFRKQNPQFAQALEADIKTGNYEGAQKAVYQEMAMRQVRGENPAPLVNFWTGLQQTLGGAAASAVDPNAPNAPQQYVGAGVRGQSVPLDKAAQVLGGVQQNQASAYASGQHGNLYAEQTQTEREGRAPTLRNLEARTGQANAAAGASGALADYRRGPQTDLARARAGAAGKTSGRAPTTNELAALAIGGDENAARTLAAAGGVDRLMKDLSRRVSGLSATDPEISGLSPEAAQGILTNLGRYDVLKQIMNQALSGSGGGAQAPFVPPPVPTAPAPDVVQGPDGKFYRKKDPNAPAPGPGFVPAGQ